MNLARATGDERARDVEREVERLDAIVPKLRIVAAGVLPADTVIRLDAVELGPAGLGVALAVEPGTHALQAAALHKLTWSTSVETKADGATTAVTIPALEDVPAAPLVVAPPVALVLPAPTAASSPWRTVGLATAGAGVVALGVGSTFGIVAMNQRNDAGCPGNVCSSDGSASTLRGAKSSADVATALFIAGGALVGGGLVVWWLSAGTGSARTGVLVTPAGVVGTF